MLQDMQEIDIPSVGNVEQLSQITDLPQKESEDVTHQTPSYSSPAKKDPNENQQLYGSTSPVGKYVPQSHLRQFGNQNSSQHVPPMLCHPNFRYGDNKTHSSRNHSETSSFIQGQRNSSIENSKQFGIVDLSQHRKRSKQLSVDRALDPAQFNQAIVTNEKVESLVSNWNQQKHQNNMFSTPTNQTANNSFSQINSFMMNTSQHSIILEMPEFLDTPTPKKSQITPVQEEDENLLCYEDMDKQITKSYASYAFQDNDLKSSDRKFIPSKQKGDPSSATARYSKQSNPSIHIDQQLKFDDKTLPKTLIAKQSKKLNTSRPLTSKNTVKVTPNLKVVKASVQTIVKTLPSQKTMRIQAPDFQESTPKTQSIKSNNQFPSQGEKQQVQGSMQKKRSQQDIVKPVIIQSQVPDRGRLVKEKTILIKQDEHCVENQREPTQLIREFKILKLQIQLAYERADKPQQSQLLIQKYPLNSIPSNLEQILKVLQLDFGFSDQ